jgi:hypothetical protein
VTLQQTPPPHRHVNRELEWACAIVLLAWGAALLMPGATFSLPTFAGFSSLATETTWGMGTVFIAGLRMLALIINGNWHPSPMLRMGTAFCGALFWAFMSYACSHDGFPGSSPWEFTFAALCGLDIFSGLRSARDQARNDRRASIARRGA